MDSHREFFKRIENWGKFNSYIKAIGLAGSYARGDAHPDSDMDLIILTDTPEFFLKSTEWIDRFGGYDKKCIEDWGAIQSVRVFFDVIEVEFGFGHPSWAQADPLDEGTASVIRGGFKIIYDPENILARLLPRASSL